jgi:hypothetical protein
MKTSIQSEAEKSIVTNGRVAIASEVKRRNCCMDSQLFLASWGDEIQLAEILIIFSNFWIQFLSVFWLFHRNNFTDPSHPFPLFYQIKRFESAPIPIK